MSLHWLVLSRHYGYIKRNPHEDSKQSITQEDTLPFIKQYTPEGFSFWTLVEKRIKDSNSVDSIDIWDIYPYKVPAWKMSIGGYYTVVDRYLDLTRTQFPMIVRKENHNTYTYLAEYEGQVKLFLNSAKDFCEHNKLRPSTKLEIAIFKQLKNNGR